MVLEAPWSDSVFYCDWGYIRHCGRRVFTSGSPRPCPDCGLADLCGDPEYEAVIGAGNAVPGRV